MSSFFAESLCVTRRILCAVAVLASGHPIAAEKAAPEQESRSRFIENISRGVPQRVVLYGTSLTAKGAWVEQLKDAVEAVYPGKVTWINSGGSGKASDWGVANLREKVIRHQPDTVFIEFSMNDAASTLGITRAQARDNLAGMVKGIRTAHPDCEIILQIMNPVDRRENDPFSPRPELALYQQDYRDFAAGEGMLCVDHMPAFMAVLEKGSDAYREFVPDGVHPGAEGYARFLIPTLLKAIGLSSDGLMGKRFQPPDPIVLLAGRAHAEDLLVYPPVPGLVPSQHYAVRVRPAGDGGAWQSAFAFETVCKSLDKKTDAYFSHLAGWTHSYVNFEAAGAVEIEIARADGEPIVSAAAHPQRKATACAVRDGKAYVSLEKPCLVAVDIDGQMDGQDTGKGYKGPPIHTVSIFANPPLAGKPKPGDPRVRTVKPGETPPSDGDWDTLHFLPGVHHVGLAFPIRANRNYYIPGDAIVYGTFSNRKWADARNVRIFGHGTLSGARIKHPKYVTPPVSEKDHGLYKPIELIGTTGTRVEGITIADSAMHSLMLVSPYKEGHPNEVRWAKIFTWRANGDGINPFGNTLVEDCFLRTQDDSLYVNGRGIRRCVIWNDANGSSFVLSSLGQLGKRGIIVEDCDVIYSRASWHHWSGGRVFNMRGEGGGAAGSGVVFRNIRIEDPRPTLQQFFLCMAMPEPYSKGGEKRKAGDLSGILFQNIAIAAPSVLGEPQMLWAQPDAQIRGLRFENLTLAGKAVRDAGFFKTNEFVSGMDFPPSSEAE